MVIRPFMAAILLATSVQAADPASHAQPVDSGKLPDLQQRTIIPLPSERLPAPAPPTSNSAFTVPNSRPADVRELDKQKKEQNWLIEGMEAKRSEREMKNAPAAETNANEYLDGYIREQKLLETMPSQTSKRPDDGKYKPALASPSWTELGISERGGASASDPFQSSFPSPGRNSTAQPFVDSSLTIHSDKNKAITPLLGPAQQQNQNEYRPPALPGVSNNQQNNIKLLSRDPNSLPNGYSDPVDRLRMERQQASQPAPQPALSREEIEHRLNETSRPRPKAAELRRSIPDPAAFE